MSSDHPSESIIHELTPHLDEEIHSRRVRGTLFIWLILTVAGVLAGLYLTPVLMPHMDSREGRGAIETVSIFTIAAAPIAALVCAVTLFSLLDREHHHSHLDTPPDDGPPLRGNAVASGIWLAVSALLVVFLLVFGLTEWSSQQVVHANALQVNVTGQQWLWTYSYPAQTVTLPGGKVVTITAAQDATTLELPINVPVQFNVTSKDVTHGFWPVDLGVQGDANPGETDIIRTTPDHLGKFTVRCSQLCGLYHAYMYTQAAVITDSAFASWISHNHGGAVLTSATASGATK